MRFPRALLKRAGVTMDPGALSELLERWIARCSGCPTVVVRNLARLPGGASRETWAFDVEYGAPASAPRRLVLRRDPPGSYVPGQRKDEYRLLQVARQAGVPVPEVFWLAEDSEALGAPGFFMEWLEGETLPRRLLRDPEYAPARAALPAQLATVLARIHAIDWQQPALDFLPRPSPDQPACLFELERFEQIYRAVAPDPHPAFELAFRWLREHATMEARRTLVHGDFRIGNVLFGPEGLRAVFDWELAHIGDPVEDLGWFCVRSWRFGNDHLPAGGLASRGELIAAYERASGTRVEPARLRYWEILGNLKWGVITILQAKGFLDGATNNVELAAIGRRSAETEWELLHLMSEEGIGG